MYYSIYYINLDQLFQKVNIPKDISGHMCLIRYQNMCVLIRHFSVAKISITHCSLYNNRGYYMAARSYEISLRVLKNISRVSAANE